MVSESNKEGVCTGKFEGGDSWDNVPAVFPNLTCSAESGMSQRNLKGSESP